MQLNTELINTNVNLRDEWELQAVSIWQGDSLLARVEFENGKVSFITKIA